VVLLVLVGVGSRCEKRNQSGLSHFLEHMFFKGTKKRPTTKEISETIDRLGGEFNAFTGEECTGYYVKVANEHIEQAADVVADILLNPLFAPEEIERERGVITEEIRMYTSMPGSHVRHLWQQALFGDHPLGWRIDGREETVAHFSQRDFLSYTKQFYHTQNTVVALAGGCTEEMALSLVRRLFAQLPAGAAVEPRLAPKRMPVQRFVFERRASLEQAYLVVGVPGVGLTHEERWPADLLSVILGGGMSSRMFLGVRERHGLAYSIHTHSKNYRDSGSFATNAGVRLDKAQLALKLILEEYNRVMQEEVTPDELTKAKQMVIGHLMLELEETNSLAAFAGIQEVLEGRVLTPKDVRERIEAVTPADIQATAQHVLHPERRAVALLGPQRSVAGFERLLNA
jgi:predicted Zn-dependent peptidase